MTKESRRGDDWKQWKRGWQYKYDAPKDKQWQKDRARLFRKNGNGWWIFQFDYYIEKKQIKEKMYVSI